MLLVAVIDWGLRSIGLAACAAVLLAYLRVRRAFKSCCDNATANARMPANAYAGRVVWITGASSGIGEELAQQLAKQNAKLILSARSKEKLEGLADELRKSSADALEVRVLPLDLKEISSLEGKAKQALALFGAIDVLINNGGYSSRALAFLSPGIQTDIDMMEVNFLSAVALAKAVLPSMHERKQGHIINISSLSGKFGVPLRTLYCGAKHAMMGWFDALRVEEAALKTGVSVTNICPGSCKTNVATNAVTDNGMRRGFSDPIIDNGLSVDFVCDRILAAAHCKLKECWLAKEGELKLCYKSQYAPELLKSQLTQWFHPTVTAVMGEQYLKSAMERLGQKV